MTRPGLFLAVILALTMVVVACEAAPTTTQAPGQTDLPGVDTPAPDPLATPAGPGVATDAPDDTPATGETPAAGETPATGETPAAGETPATGATTQPGGGAGGILAQVQSRGSLICGVHTGLPGFAFPEEGTGRFLGFDADFCRAVAAAVLGDAEAVEFRPLSADDRSTALQSREIDVLIRNTTWTLDRDANWGLFAPTTYYDGQGMMVRADAGVTQLSELGGATICVQSGTTTEQNLADAMAAAGVQYTAATGDSAFTYTTYDAGDCDAVSSDMSQLTAQRTALANPEDHVILDTVMSKEPLGPVVPFGDDRWFNVVKWTVFATIAAEELGVDSSNVTQMRDTSEDISVRRLLGVEDSLGSTKLGLDDAWAFNIISSVGNYGEIYNRNLGPGTPFDVPRGVNNLWTEGGLLYSPPIR